MRFEEGSYEGEVGETKLPNGEGIFEFRLVLNNTFYPY